MGALHGVRPRCSRSCKRSMRPTHRFRSCPSRDRKRQPRLPCQQQPAKAAGNAIIEVLVSLLAVTPFIAGIPLLGKQFDVKHKTLDAARYAVWERTIWRNAGSSNRKHEEDIAVETRDRVLGDATVGLTSVAELRMRGVSTNPLWRDNSNKPLLAYRDGHAPVSIGSKQLVAPVDVGHLLAPGLAYGGELSRTIGSALGVSDLKFGRQTFTQVAIALELRDVLSSHARDDSNPRLVQRADAAILSDTWSARDENSLRRRVDDLTTNELVESLEFAGRLIARQAPGKGKPMYGEGQFANEPDLRPVSSALPAAFVRLK